MKNKSLIITILSLFILTLINCKKNTSSEDSNEMENLLINFEKTEGTPFESILIETNDMSLNQKEVKLIFDNEKLNHTILENKIFFSIPDKKEGNYNVKLSINESIAENSFYIISAPTIENIEEYVTNIQTEIENIRQLKKEREDELIDLDFANEEEVLAKRTFWNNLYESTKQDINSMSTEEKRIFVTIWESNKLWIEELNNTLTGYSRTNRRSSLEDCKNKIKSGKEAAASASTFGETMSAFFTSLSAYRCAWTESKVANKNSSIGKAIHLYRNIDFSPSFSGVLNTVQNFISEKIEYFTDEINELAGSEYIADRIEDVNRRSDFNFCNGEGISTYLKIKYRTLRPTDENSDSEYGIYSKLFSEYIDSYNEMLSILKEGTLKNQLNSNKPRFIEVNKTIEVNKNLNVYKSSVSNSKVVFINSQYENQGKDWKIIFATDEPNLQSFTFDIVYNDGMVNLKKNVSATVEKCEGCGGQTSFVDARDGQRYSIVKIGDVCWMGQNLNFASEYSYCPEDKELNCSVYGRLYQWWPIADTVCPDGWRLPNLWEVKDLINGSYYNSNQVSTYGKNAADLMSTSLWHNKLGTNLSKFNALPTPPLGQMRYEKCLDDDCNQKEPIYFDKTQFWSGSSFNSGKVTFYLEDNTDGKSTEYPAPYAAESNSSQLNWEGLHIRCVKE